MDNKVIIYGLLADGSAQRAVTVSQDGFIGSNLYLQGSTIFSVNPFDPEFNFDDGVLDMLPVVNFGYLCGPLDPISEINIFGRAKYCSAESMLDPTASQMVAELAGDFAHDTPAVNTAAQCNVAASADQLVRITGFGFSITAVAAIVAPVLVTLTADVGGTPTILFQRRYNVPAGTTVDRWIEGPFSAFQDARLDVAAPGATNFVTAEIAFTATGSAPS